MKIGGHWPNVFQQLRGLAFGEVAAVHAAEYSVRMSSFKTPVERLSEQKAHIMSTNQRKFELDVHHDAREQKPGLPACPACGGELIEIRSKLQCSHCHRICETCCEGGRG